MRGQRPKRPRHVRREPRHNGVIVARTLDEKPPGKARYYRGPGGASRVVVKSDNTFTVEPWAIAPRGLARMPAALAERVNAALGKGKTHG